MCQQLLIEKNLLKNILRKNNVYIDIKFTTNNKCKK